MILSFEHNVLLQNTIKKVYSINENNIEEVSEKKPIINKTIKELLSELSLNTKISMTFGIGVSALFSPVRNFIEKMDIQVSNLEIYMMILTFLCLSLEHSNHKNIETINSWKKDIITDKKIFDKVLDFLGLLSSLIKNILKSTGKTISSIIDIFNYTSLFIPILDMVNGLLSNNDLPTIKSIIIAMVLATGGFLTKKLFN